MWSCFLKFYQRELRGSVYENQAWKMAHDENYFLSKWILLDGYPSSWPGAIVHKWWASLSKEGSAAGGSYPVIDTDPIMCDVSTDWIKSNQMTYQLTI